MREKYSVHLALATGCLVFLFTLLFALLQSPEILSTSVQGGVAIPHPIAGRHKCDHCHGRAGIRPYPVRHVGWNNASCTKCHLSPDSVMALPHANFSGNQAKSVPERGAGRFSASLAKGGGPAAGKKAPLISHPVKGQEDCLACHDTKNEIKPAPPDHEGRQNETCEGCHSRGGM